MKKILISLVIVWIPTLTIAQEFKEARVRTEITKESQEICKLSESSFTAQIETSLRSNGIKVTKIANGPTFYVNLSATEYGLDSCRGHGYLQVFNYVDEIKLPWSKNKISGIFEHCIKTFSFIGQKGFDLQEKLTSNLGDLTRQCVSSIFKN
jgi:hypothetical protein